MICCCCCCCCDRINTSLGHDRDLDKIVHDFCFFTPEGRDERTIPSVLATAAAADEKRKNDPRRARLFLDREKDMGLTLGGICEYEKESSSSSSIHNKKNFILGQYAKSTTKDIVHAFRHGTELGRGMTAVVVRSKREDGTYVAIKKIDKTSHFSSMIKKMVRFEVSLFSELKRELSGHRHICEFVEAYEDSKSIYIVMELMHGGDLFDYFISVGGPLKEAKSRILVTQLAKGLLALHKHGVIHRDMKPENVVLKYKDRDFPENSLKIMDFGFSLRDGIGCEGAKEPIVVGSPQYMSPEIVRAYVDRESPRYTTKVDVWALGVMFYIMLAGIMPFKNDGNVMKMHREVLTTKISFEGPQFRSVSQNAIDLLRRMLRRDPKQRISIEEVLAHSWITEASRREVKTPTKGISTVQHLARLRGRKRFMKAVVAVSWGVRHNQLHQKRIASEVDVRRSSAIRALVDAPTFDVASLRQLRNRMLECLAKQQHVTADKVDVSSIDANLFERAFDAAGEPWTKTDAKRLFDTFDTDKNGALDWREIILGLLGLVSADESDRLRACFALCDADGSGDLNADELTVVLRNAAVTMSDPSKVMRRFRDALTCCDVNVDGSVEASLNFEQFASAIEHDPILHDAFLGKRSTDRAGGSKIEDQPILGNDESD